MSLRLWFAICQVYAAAYSCHQGLFDLFDGTMWTDCIGLWRHCLPWFALKFVSLDKDADCQLLALTQIASHEVDFCWAFLFYPISDTSIQRLEDLFSSSHGWNKTFVNQVLAVCYKWCWHISYVIIQMSKSVCYNIHVMIYIEHYNCYINPNNWPFCRFTGDQLCSSCDKLEDYVKDVGKILQYLSTWWSTCDWSEMQRVQEQESCVQMTGQRELCQLLLQCFSEQAMTRDQTSKLESCNLR